MTKEELEAKLAEVEKENAQLKESADKLAELEEENAQLKESQETLLKSNEELQSSLESTQKEADAVLPTIKVGKDTYRVRARKFQYAGKQYTFEDLKKDKDLQKALIEKESGILIKR